VKNTVILGADEIANQKANVKNMETGEQVELALDEISDYILKVAQ
jgi:histidyl-tRNA synthetase